jgi:hypothetical protein
MTLHPLIPSNLPPAGALRLVQLIDYNSILCNIAYLSHWPWFFAGPVAIFTVGPVALGIGLLANYIVKRNLMASRTFFIGVVVASLGALWFFRHDALDKAEREFRSKYGVSSSVIQQRVAEGKSALPPALSPQSQQLMPKTKPNPWANGNIPGYSGSSSSGEAPPR